jgi:hypothetical protein
LLIGIAEGIRNKISIGILTFFTVALLANCDRCLPPSIACASEAVVFPRPLASGAENFTVGKTVRPAQGSALELLGKIIRRKVQSFRQILRHAFAGTLRANHHERTSNSKTFPSNFITRKSACP